MVRALLSVEVARARQALAVSETRELLIAASKRQTGLLVEDLRACNSVRVAQTQACVPRARRRYTRCLVIVVLAGLGAALVGVVVPVAALEGASLLVELGLRAITVAGVVDGGCRAACGCGGRRAR